MTLLSLPRLTLPAAVRDLALGIGDGFALTHTAVYRWPLLPGEAARAMAEGDKTLPQPAANLPLQCLLEGQNHLCQLALSPQGHWAAVVKRDRGRLTSPSRSLAEDALLLLRLGKKQKSRSLSSRTPSVRELKLRPGETLSGVHILDRRHGAALISSSGESQRLGLFSRRGQWLSYFSLPVSLDYWVRGITAYELWALEAGHPKILLKLGLKPFRLERIPLAIAPDQIYPLPWGCVLANQAGEILLLNREGQSLGQLQVPLSADCQKLWLTAMAPHWLVLVIQQLEGAKLCSLDLRELELMLVF